MTLRQLFQALTIFGLYFATIPLFGLGMLWLGPPLLIAMARWYGFLRSWEAAALIVLMLLVGFWATPPVHVARGPNNSSMCRNHLKMICLALLNYHDDHGTYPPLVAFHANGRPMHSWRILIASYIEQDDLRRAYDLDEPWNGPSNARLHGKPVRLFQCPSDTAANRSNDKISYLAVILPSAKPGDPFPVIEVPNSGVTFFEPRDLQLADLIPGKAKVSINAKHGGAKEVYVGWPDGLVERIPVAELATRLQEFEDAQKLSE